MWPPRADWSGVGSTSRAYVADVTTPEQRTEAMGKMGGWPPTFPSGPGSRWPAWSGGSARATRHATCHRPSTATLPLAPPGISMVCFGIGAPLGTFVAGLLNDFRTPFLLSAACTAVLLGVIFFRLPEEKKLRVALDGRPHPPLELILHPVRRRAQLHKQASHRSPIVSCVFGLNRDLVAAFLCTRVDT